jgi:hypothetical protein
MGSREAMQRLFIARLAPTARKIVLLLARKKGRCHGGTHKFAM